MKLELEQLEDIKSTITWLLENGSFIDLETSYNSAMNSVNTLDEAINYIRCCKIDSEQLVCNYCLEKKDTLPDNFGCQSCIDNYK